MPHYVITGRISGADEDSLFLVTAADEDAATTEAERLAWEEVLDDDQTPADRPDAEFFCNTVVACDTKPTVVHSHHGGWHGKLEP